MADRGVTRAVAAALWRRRGSDSIELYLGQRGARARFLPGYWAFPGGGLQPTDDAVSVAGAEGEPAALIAACVREVAEETGLALPLDASRYAPAGRWLTPAFSPIRFDATYWLVEMEPGVEPDLAAGDGELTAGAWVTPDEALARWATGTWLIPYPVVRVLRALAPGLEGATARCEAEASAEAAAPRLWELARGVAVSPLRTPTLPPATHTNCYVVGAGDVVVIDPATPYPDEQAALDVALDALAGSGRQVSAIWLTHHHPDHVGYAAALAARLGVPIAAHAETARLLAPQVTVDRLLADGDTLDLPGDPPRRLRAVFTPGHAPGHLCFHELHTGLLIVGDMVASVGTIVVDPDEGDMTAYLDSLARLKALGPTALLPAHGAAIADVNGKIDHYVGHRLWREQRVLDALAARGHARASELVGEVYADVPVILHPLAERSLLAHLLKLARDQRVQRRGDLWVV